MIPIFLAVVLTILLTPGPTNTLLASAGAQLGMRRACPLIFIEALGYLSAISFWGYFTGALAQLFPSLPPIIQLMSAFYILYLALKLWRSSQSHLALQQGIRQHEVFLATLLNPKALILATVVFPIQTWQDMAHYSLYTGLFLMLLVPIASFWIFLGSLLKSSEGRWFNQRRLQKVAAIVLFSFAIPLSYSAATALQN
ncbi:LysE family transporter [Pseudomonas sp. F1_0610]|uniref:LysE family translocator n=1 Tax=Pseudomonas sp. F1_0610 TaxID=3114284 RepID=UPI0039C169B5